MRKSQRDKKGLYYGWIIVAAAFMSMFLCFAPAINLSGLFVAPIADEFGVSRTAVVTNTTIFIFSNMLAAMFSGRILSKYPIRFIVPAAAVVITGCYVGCSFATTLPQIYLLSCLRGVAGAFTTVIPISILLNNWFGKKIRGKAMGFAMIGSGFGAVLMSPLTGYIIGGYGWRSAYLFFAGLTVLMIPITMILYVQTPAAKGITRIGDDESQLVSGGGNIALSGLTTTQALKTSMFWFAALSVLLLSAASQSFVNNSAAFLSDLSFDPTTVASIISICSAGAAIGKIIIGAVCDKWGVKTGVTFGAGLIFIGYIMMVAAGLMPVISIPAAAICGVGMSSTTIVIPLITSELYGNRSYGTLVGYMNTASSLGSSTIPLAVTLVYDMTGSYNPAWIALCILVVIVVLMINAAFGMRKKVYRKLEETSEEAVPAT